MPTSSFNKKFIINSHNAASLIEDLEKPQTVVMTQRDYQSDNQKGFELLLKKQEKRDL